MASWCFKHYEKEVKIFLSRCFLVFFCFVCGFVLCLFVFRSEFMLKCKSFWCQISLNMCNKYGKVLDTFRVWLSRSRSQRWLHLFKISVKLCLVNKTNAESLAWISSSCLPDQRGCVLLAAFSLYYSDLWVHHMGVLQGREVLGNWGTSLYEAFH